MKEDGTARLSEENRNELQAFWRAHIQGWRDSTLNHRECCEAYGLPLKRFGNWRAKFRDEDPRLTDKLLFQRGGASKHMLMPMRSEAGSPYVPCLTSAPDGETQGFDQRRISGSSKPVWSKDETEIRNIEGRR